MRRIELKDIKQNETEFNVADIYNIMNATFKLTAAMHLTEMKADVDEGVVELYCNTIWANVAQFINDSIPYEYKEQ